MNITFQILDCKYTTFPIIAQKKQFFFVLKQFLFFSLVPNNDQIKVSNNNTEKANILNISKKKSKNLE